MNTRQDLINYLVARGIKFEESISDEDLKKIVAERIAKEAQTS